MQLEQPLEELQRHPDGVCQRADDRAVPQHPHFFSAATWEEQQRQCDLWKADFNNCRPHEALGMKTPSQVYSPSATPYAGKKIELLHPERMLVRTVFGRGFIKYRSTMIQLTEALAGDPVAIDPHSGPPHDLWFSHRRIGLLTLDAPRPFVDVDVPALVALNDLHKDTYLLTQPALESTGPRTEVLPMSCLFLPRPPLLPALLPPDYKPAVQPPL